MTVSTSFTTPIEDADVGKDRIRSICNFIEVIQNCGNESTSEPRDLFLPYAVESEVMRSQYVYCILVSYLTHSVSSLASLASRYHKV